MPLLPLAGSPALAPSPAPSTVLQAFSANGFRPFFLAAAAFAALAVPTWLLVLNGAAAPATGYLMPMGWHAHEMVFGYATAVIAGFLLTAVTNWTGRRTATGGALYALAALWLLGRVALVVAPRVPSPLVAIADLSFLPALAVVLARPLAAAGSKRNYVMLVVLGLLFAANLSVHLDALGLVRGWQLAGSHAGVDIVVLLCAIIAGRVIPMFTRNATGSKRVVSVKALDVAALVALVAYGAVDVFVPTSPVVGVMAALAALLLVVRAARWGALSSLRHPLLWILHVGHAWIVVGLGLRAASALMPAIPVTASTHALTVGAIGSLTLGMMARVALGHTGRVLVAQPLTVAAFVLLTGATCARVLGPLVPALTVPYATWLIVSGSAWAAAFTLFGFAYARILTSPRVDGKPG